MGNDRTEERIAGLESDLLALTKNVAALTASTQQLVESQREVHNVIKQQARHSADMEHFREALGRAFKETDEIRREVRKVATRVEVSAAVDKARVGFLQFLFRYWHVVSLLTAAGGIVGYVSNGK